MSSTPNPNTPDGQGLQGEHAPAARDGSIEAAPSRSPRLSQKSHRVAELPQFRVMLHDDETTEMTFVVRSIVELTPLSAPLARDVMLSAHEHGVAEMLVTHKERAELYYEQFAAKGLTVTIEPAN